MTFVDVLVVAGAYLLGSVPSGYVIVRLARGADIREVGSGNIGASNVWRQYGARLGAPVALFDVAKGLVPALVGVAVGGDVLGLVAGAAAMLGHARPVWMGFRRGGKMVATGGGVSFALLPIAAALCLGVWIVTFLLFRYASVASLVTAAALPVLALVLGEPWPTVLFAVAAFVAVVVLHRQNVRRLLDGTESRFSWRRTSVTGEAPPPERAGRA